MLVRAICFSMPWQFPRKKNKCSKISRNWFYLFTRIRFFPPTTFMLWVAFSPVHECVEIGLLESNFSEPAAAPGTPLLFLLFYTYPHSFPLRLVGDRVLIADSSYTTIYIIPTIHLLCHLYIAYTIYTLIIPSIHLLYHLYIYYTAYTLLYHAEIAN